MSELTIVVHGMPAPQGSKRHVGHGRMIESSKKVAPWREAVKAAALNVIEHGVVHFTSAVWVGIDFTFPRPRSHYRTGRNAELLRTTAPLTPAGKPDLDKLCRSTFDALTDAGVWRDDSQVVVLMATKAYAATAGAQIRVRAS